MAADVLLWSAHECGLSPAAATDLLGAVHPSLSAQLGIFVVGHVVGTVLLGLAVLRAKLVARPVAWALTVSQPLHLVAAVTVGSPGLDLFAWCLTAAGMAGLAGRPYGCRDRGVALRRGRGRPRPGFASSARPQRAPAGTTTPAGGSEPGARPAGPTA